MCREPPLPLIGIWLMHNPKQKNGHSHSSHSMASGDICITFRHFSGVYLS